MNVWPADLCASAILVQRLDTQDGKIGEVRKNAARQRFQLVVVEVPVR